VLTRHALHEDCGSYDRDFTERIEREQIAVAVDDQVRMTMDRQFEKFVLSGVAACRDPLR
jgi:hypothetical protein